MGRHIIFTSPEIAFSDDDFADSPTEEEINDDSKIYYHNGYRSMDDEEEEIYNQAISEHDGFGDIPTFPKTYAPFGSIAPGHEPYHSDVQVCAVEAIKHYNIKNATNYEFVKVVKLNHAASRGTLYYITFKAKQIGTTEEFPTTTFEALVLSGIHDHLEVDFCRLKGSNSSS